MATRESHGRIGIGRLLSQNRTSKDGVVATLGAEVDLYGKLVFGVEDARDLPLLHHLFDVEKGGEGGAAGAHDDGQGGLDGEAHEFAGILDEEVADLVPQGLVQEVFVGGGGKLGSGVHDGTHQALDLALVVVDELGEVGAGVLDGQHFVALSQELDELKLVELHLDRGLEGKVGGAAGGDDGGAVAVELLAVFGGPVEGGLEVTLGEGLQDEVQLLERFLGHVKVLDAGLFRQAVANFQLALKHTFIKPYSFFKEINIAK